MDIYRFSSRDKRFVLRTLGFGLGSIYSVYSLYSFVSRKGVPEGALLLILFGVLCLAALLVINLFFCEFKSLVYRDDFYLTIDEDILSIRSLAFQGDKKYKLKGLKSYIIKGGGKKHSLKLIYKVGKPDLVIILLSESDPRMKLLKEKLDSVIARD